MTTENKIHKLSDAAIIHYYSVTIELYKMTFI